MLHYVEVEINVFLLFGTFRGCMNSVSIFMLSLREPTKQTSQDLFANYTPFLYLN